MLENKYLQHQMNASGNTIPYKRTYFFCKWGKEPLKRRTRQRKITPRCSIIWAVNKEPGLLFSSSYVHSLSIHASIDDFPSGFRLNFYSIPIPAQATDLCRFTENILIITFETRPHTPKHISYFFIILLLYTTTYFELLCGLDILFFTPFPLPFFCKTLFPYTFTSISFALLLYLREWVSFILTRSTASSFSCKKRIWSYTHTTRKSIHRKIHSRFCLWWLLMLKFVNIWLNYYLLIALLSAVYSNKSFSFLLLPINLTPFLSVSNIIRCIRWYRKNNRNEMLCIVITHSNLIWPLMQLNP